jgi:ferric-dicitrate binding protein FerR (iron transport regulator)
MEAHALDDEDDEDQEQDVGSKLDQIRAEQARQASAKDVELSSDDDDADREVEERWQRAKQSHQQAFLTDFSQDLSTSSLPQYCNQPSPAGVLNTIAVP